MQAEQHVATLPHSALDASATYFAQYLGAARALLNDPGTQALAIVLPAAGTDHDDWRCAIAHDLAREYTPKRVNVVGGSGAALIETLAYLGNAPGVTGQYCPLYE